MIELGKLSVVDDLRTAWPNEARDFTPWLASNINVLGEEIGVDISSVKTESSVGSFNVDIFAIDADTGRIIIIENQLEDTNHDHLGKLITYAAGKSASLVVWVVKRAREEHRAAIEWLNSHTDEDVGFFLCEIKLYRINDSAVAPKFEIIQQPNNWAKISRETGFKRAREILPKIRDMLQWGAVNPGDVLVAKGTSIEAILLPNGHVNYQDEEMSLQDWLRRVYGWQSVETYRYTVQAKTGKSLSQIRNDYISVMRFAMTDEGIEKEDE